MRYSSRSFVSVTLLVGVASAFAPGHRRKSVIACTSGRRTFAVPSSSSIPTYSSTSSRLWESRVPQTDTGKSVSPEYPSVQVDFDALLKYHGAIVIQLAIIYGIFKGLDAMVDITGIADGIPTFALAPIFYALSLKSRVFNPLNNERPNMKQAIQNGEPSKGFRDRVMPSWTPPGPVFPIMWLLIIGPLRAYSSALVWQANGHVFCDPAIFAFIFHLAVGDVWNTINNAEQRHGAAVTGVLCVTASALNAAYQYHTVDEMAGTLLGLPMIWFAVAASLVTATWRLNPINGMTTTEEGQEIQHLDPLYPIVREGRPTTFAWFKTAVK